MIQPRYSYCPRCGGKLTIKQHEGIDHHVCTVCNFVFYQNQNATTAGIIVRDNKILLVRRSRQPYKGMLDIPGGFVEPLESPEEGMLRELKEELGVEGKIIKILGVYGPDPYEFDGQTTYNSSAHYQVDIGNQEPHPNDDAESIEWWDLQKLNAKMQLPFPSNQKCIEKLQTGELHLD